VVVCAFVGSQLARALAKGCRKFWRALARSSTGPAADLGSAPEWVKPQCAPIVEGD